MPCRVLTVCEVLYLPMLSSLDMARTWHKYIVPPRKSCPTNSNFHTWLRDHQAYTRFKKGAALGRRALATGRG